MFIDNITRTMVGALVNLPATFNSLKKSTVTFLDLQQTVFEDTKCIHRVLLTGFMLGHVISRNIPQRADSFHISPCVMDFFRAS